MARGYLPQLILHVSLAIEGRLSTVPALLEAPLSAKTLDMASVWDREVLPPAIALLPCQSFP